MAWHCQVEAAWHLVATLAAGRSASNEKYTEESEHNYGKNMNLTKKLYIPGAPPAKLDTGSI